MAAEPSRPRKVGIDPTKERWQRGARKTHEEVAQLRQVFRDKVIILQKATIGQMTRPKASQSIKRVANQKKALQEVGLKLRAAKRKLEEHFEVQAKRQCLSICRDVSSKLPLELRDLIYDHLIMEPNATFYTGPTGAIKLTNGCSNIQHCFDVDFTGPAMHIDIVQELNRRGVRFDFRHRHALLRETFTQYTSLCQFDLTSAMNNVSIILNMGDLKGRALMTDHLKALFQLRKGAHIYAFIITSGRTQGQMAHSFRQITRSIINFLARLRQAGYDITVVMNPECVRSTVRNNSGSHFSIIPPQEFSYSFSLRDYEYSTTGIEHKLKEYFDRDNDF